MVCVRSRFLSKDFPGETYVLLAGLAFVLFDGGGIASPLALIVIWVALGLLVVRGCARLGYQVAEALADSPQS